MTENVVDKLKDAFEGILGDRKTLIKILSIILILLVALVLRIHDQNKADITIETDGSSDEIEYSEENSPGQEDTFIFVDIGGAVEKPGVYKVNKDTRLFQVIEMAGGLSEDADTDNVNRASFVEDGQKIVIPAEGDVNNNTLLSEPSPSGTVENGLVNINTATADELKTLSGVGDVMAERIIEYRSTRAFKSTEDIMSVEGIGSKTYEKIKDHITV